MKVIARLFPSAALLALHCMSSGVVTAQSSFNVVKYDFNDEDNRLRNKGRGIPFNTANLDGFVLESYEIPNFNGEGRDGTAPARFGGYDQVMRIPESVDINVGNLTSRTISFDFLTREWPIVFEPTSFRMIFQQGGSEGNINIYLQFYETDDFEVSVLAMAVWSRDPITGEFTRTVIRTAFDRDVWHTATMIVDTESGTLSGYLDSDQFDKKDVDFFPISGVRNVNCLGGYTGNTTIFLLDGNDTPHEETWQYNRFKGSIDNFVIRNQLPPASENKPAVEYLFDKSEPKHNSGTGTDLNGKPRPKRKNGINFEGIGASFKGKGCVRVPNSDDVNESRVWDRTIMFDFKWDGKTDDDDDPEILFEEGGTTNGVNLYLDPDGRRRRKAELVMAVWETTNGGKLKHEFVNRTIRSNTWYSAALVIDSSAGTLTGYVDGEEFDQVNVDFLPIKGHEEKNCIGGMREDTRLFRDGRTPAWSLNGLYFKGSIDKFQLFNSVERPVLPTASPSSIPSDVPTVAPSSSPSLLPTKTPSSSPTTTSAPSVSPTDEPTNSIRSVGDAGGPLSGGTAPTPNGDNVFGP